MKPLGVFFPKKSGTCSFFQFFNYNGKNQSQHPHIGPLWAGVCPYDPNILPSPAKKNWIQSCIESVLRLFRNVH